MPHFIIHCSENILLQKTPAEIMSAVYDISEASGLFREGDIKVRIQPFQFYQLANDKKDFLHVFACMMEGRTTEQKANLSKKIIEILHEILPDISILSMNVSEFELATYSNKSLINPLNTERDRFY